MVKKENKRLIYRLLNNPFESNPYIICTPDRRITVFNYPGSGLFRTIHFAQYIPFIKGMY